MSETHNAIAPLTDGERLALMQCDHAVARCPACSLSHRFSELARDRFCARCRADLFSELRVHLRGCPDTMMNRSRAAIRTAEDARKESRRVRDAAAVSRAESEVLRKDASTARAGRDRVCPVCGLHMLPGEHVSFQHGKLLHLACWENQRQRRR